MKYDVIIIGAGPSGIFCAYELIRSNPERAGPLKIGTVQSGQRKNVSAVNHAPLRPDLPEPEHFPMVNYPSLRMSAEICRRFSDMTGPLNY